MTGDTETGVKKGAVKVVTLGEEKTPLAAAPFEESVRLSWWWLLLIAVFGAAGKAMYEKHKEKVEARQQARNKDNEDR
ncbi:MAG: hypothetical protein K5770_11375 [Lachnospiraceae bacterium]|nr:hypothetical protein [Lachnospiraceae bacterium]